MKLSFVQLVRLLWRAQDWEKDALSMWDDSIRHKTMAIQFYSDCPASFRDKSGGETLYMTNPLTWAIFCAVFIPRVRRAVFGGAKS